MNIYLTRPDGKASRKASVCLLLEEREARNDDTSSILTPCPKHVLFAVPLLRVVSVEGWTDHSYLSHACMSNTSTT